MKADWIDRWKGGTVICIGSGPSLTEEDCEIARRAELPTIVTNTTYKRCPWAEVLFGFDGAWWRRYRAEVAAEFHGKLVTCSNIGRLLDVETLPSHGWFQNFANSGASAISLAVTGGAAEVLLIGFDCQKTGGQVHWHGDHPKELSNARSIANWHRHFRSVGRLADRSGTQVMNCSRETALTCFPRARLEEVL